MSRREMESLVWMTEIPGDAEYGQMQKAK